jgi:hypothetical protein
VKRVSRGERRGREGELTRKKKGRVQEEKRSGDARRDGVVNDNKQTP